MRFSFMVVAVLALVSFLLLLELIFTPQAQFNPTTTSHSSSANFVSNNTNTQTNPSNPQGPSSSLAASSDQQSTVSSTSSGSTSSTSSHSSPAADGMTIETKNYLLFVPSQKNQSNDSILIVGFSPVGDARSILSAWLPAAKKRGWPIFASKTFHNGELPETFDAELWADINNISAWLNYTKPNLVVTGFSGGGQFSHALAAGYPSKVTMVVTNCGIIKRGYYELAEYYPHNKTVLFIASPTDFRYQDMKEDKKFLESLGWKTGWIEFQGGHVLASPTVYEKAAEWMDSVHIR